jgi:hypothetical protein
MIVEKEPKRFRLPRDILWWAALCVGLAIGYMTYKVALDIWTADYVFLEQHLK